jgi:hypothetical protein
MSKSAVPLDPREGSGQVPTFSANITDFDGKVRKLSGTQVTLRDWTGSDTTGTIAQVNSSQPTRAALDVNTVFERLNTEQTVYPMMTATYNGQTGNTVTPEHVLRQWCMMAGVTPLRVPDRLLHYVHAGSGADCYGYAADSPVPWSLLSREWNFLSNSSMTFRSADVAGGVKFPSLHVNQNDSLIFGGLIPGASLAATLWFQFDISAVGYGSVIFTVARNADGTWTLREQSLPEDSNIYVITWEQTFTYAPASDVFVALKVSVDPTNSAKIIPTLRLIEQQSGASVYHDFTGTSVTSNLLYNPVPYEISLYPGVSPAGTAYDRPSMAFISSSNSLPTGFPVEQVIFDGGVTGASPMSACPGFTDNLWNRVREFCSIYEIEYDLVGGAIVFKDRSRVTKDDAGNFIPAHVLRTSAPSSETQARERARRVEVVWSQPTSTPNDFYWSKMIWKADSVYSVNKGETLVETIQSNASFTAVWDPVPVSGEPVPYDLDHGTYVVTGNDGYIVDPQWWTDNGGSITANPTGKAGEFKLTIQAPAIDTVRAPYRISEGQADRPALYIFADGIPFEQKKMQSYTGDGTAAQDIGVSYAAPFITDELTARNTAHKLACSFSGSSSTISFDISRADMLVTQKSDGSFAAPHTYEALPLGDNVRWDGSYFRVLDLSLGPSGYNVTKAEMNNTIGVINNEVTREMSIADWNTYHGDSPIREANLCPIPDNYVVPFPLFPSDSLFPGDALYPHGG